ncbi:MAG: Twin-arginine translocation protein TatA [Labilithrix sp.]|nr:Twin-arginine translocation protein TatA [Labilithrix sp.]
MPFVACQHWGDAARIPMTDDAVLALLRQHFTGVDAMYLCPSIPGKKELAARSVHARHLPSDERVLALFDDTVFGSGDDGFLVTSRRVCWKNVAGRAQMIEWQHVDPDRMYVDRRKLVLGAQAIDAIELHGDESVVAVLEACEEAFHVLAFSARACSRAPVGGSGVVLMNEPDAEATDELPTLRPSAPAADLPAPHPPAPLESEVAPRSDPKPAIANATPPPPAAVTYASYVVHASSQRGPKFACWHCQTPLHWSTPQCAHCSAWPSPQGWLRTA